MQGPLKKEAVKRLLGQWISTRIQANEQTLCCICDLPSRDGDVCNDCIEECKRVLLKVLHEEQLALMELGERIEE